MGTIIGLCQLVVVCGTALVIAFGVLLAWPGGRLGPFVCALITGIATACAAMKAIEEENETS